MRRDFVLAVSIAVLLSACHAAAERSLFNAELSAADARRARLAAVADLYRALGGGWNPAK